MCGTAQYFNIDLTTVRVGWAIFGCLGVSCILAYIAAALIIPVKPLEQGE